MATKALPSWTVHLPLDSPLSFTSSRVHQITQKQVRQKQEDKHLPAINSKPPSDNFLETHTPPSILILTVPMGGSQTNGTTVLYSSSLALLQERFRQLQKNKEMRKEKELLRIFAEAEQASQRTRCEQAKCFFHPELIQPSRPLHVGSPSLQLDSYGDHSEIQALETSLSIGLLHNKGMHASQNSNETGVDTTLHL